MLGPVAAIDIACIISRETGIETYSYHKSGSGKGDFIEGLALVGPFELGLEDQVHWVEEDGEKEKSISGGKNSTSHGLET